MEFTNCVAFAGLAETIAQYVQKGQEIYVEGRLQTRDWEDKNKVKHRQTEVIVNNFQFGQKAKGSPAETSQESSEMPSIDVTEGEIKSEDLPF